MVKIIGRMGKILAELTCKMEIGSFSDLRNAYHKIGEMLGSIDGDSEPKPCKMGVVQALALVSELQRQSARFVIKEGGLDDSSPVFGALGAARSLCDTVDSELERWKPDLEELGMYVYQSWAVIGTVFELLSERHALKCGSKQSKLTDPSEFVMEIGERLFEVKGEAS